MIYITGDLHGEIERFDDKRIKKLKKDDYLIVCGDFGFIWDGSAEEKRTLTKLATKKFTILFIDGKHENFDLLESYPVVEWHGGQTHKIAENIYHLMRGQIFDIEGKKILAFGGGESPDKEYRLSAGTWWERELPNINEMKQCLANLENVDKEVDYVITHEPPLDIKKLIDRGHDSINTLESFLNQLQRKLRFKKWYFGCMHIDRKITSRHQAVFSDVIPVEAPVKKGFFRR